MNCCNYINNWEFRCCYYSDDFSNLWCQGISENVICQMTQTFMFSCFTVTIVAAIAYARWLVTSVLTSLSFSPSFLDFHKILEHKNISENPAIRIAESILKEPLYSPKVQECMKLHCSATCMPLSHSACRQLWYLLVTAMYSLLNKSHYLYLLCTDYCINCIYLCIKSTHHK